MSILSARVTRMLGVIAALVAVLLLGAGQALAAPAPAVHRTTTRQAPGSTLNPIPSCGSHFALSRSGKQVHVVGIGLKDFGLAYYLVWPSDSSGTNYGSYNASSQYGANFYITTPNSNKRTIGIDLTDDDNEFTLCSSSYYV